MAGKLRDFFKGKLFDPDIDEYEIDNGGYGDDSDIDEYEQEEVESGRGGYTSHYMSKRPPQKIVNIQTNVQMSIAMASPKSLEEAGEVCDDLKEQKTVIVNLEDVEHEVAQRITDFLCGACYALGGSIRLISDDILLIGPIDVELTGDFKEKLRASGIKFNYRSAL